jgi:hypothetical protein
MVSNPSALPSNPTVAGPQPVPTVFTFAASGPRAPWSGDISFLSLDAAITVIHTKDIQITEHPVEQGSDVTDNARPKPDGLQIEGFISGTPFGANVPNGFAGNYTNQPGATTDSSGNAYPSGQTGRAKQAFDLLRQIASNGTVITVSTDIHVYDNMLIESLSFPQDALTGDSLRFSCKLKAVRIVASTTVVPVTKTTIHKGKTKDGKKVAADATTQTNQSAAAKLVDLSTTLGKKFFGNTSGQ